MPPSPSRPTRSEVAFPRSSGTVTAEPISQTQTASGVDFAAVWSAIRAGKWLILASVVLATAAAVAYSVLVTPTYEASAVISIGSQGTSLPGTEAVVAQVPLVPSEIGMLEKSTELAKRVHGSLTATAASLGTSEFFPLLQPEASIDRPAWEELLDRMSFRNVGVDLISITATSSAPEEASQLANLYASEYADHSRERTRASLVAARTYLEDQLQQSEAILDEIQREWERYSRERDIVAQGSGGERTIAEYTTLLSRRNTVNFEARRLSNLNDILRLQVASIEPGSTETTSVRDQSRIAYLTAQIGELQKQIEPWYLNDPTLRGNEERQPQLKLLVDRVEQFETELQEINRKLFDQTLDSPGQGSAAQRVAQIQAEIDRNDLTIRQYRADEAEITRQINLLASQIDQIPSQIFEVDEMERRRNREQAYVEGLRTRLREYMIAEQAELGFVNVLRPATVPRTPVAPDLQGNLIMALLLGTVFGAGLAFLRSAVSNQLQSPDELENLGYRLLGVVPSMHREIQSAFKGKREIEINGKVRSAALVTLHSPWSPAAEHYRLVRTNLQAIARDSRMRVMLVTSPEPADGKTVSSVNMAISMAQNGSKTLLVDCDLRKASVARTLGVDRSPGLGEILTEELAPENFEAFKTDIENLYCLPAGQVSSPPPELLGSPIMAQVLELARRDFDIVIIDTPPVLAVTDAVVLAPLCDTAVVVVAANKTSPRGVRTTIGTLKNLGVSIAGVVFNQFNQNRASAGYYEYQYGYAYAEESDS